MTLQRKGLALQSQDGSPPDVYLDEQGHLAFVKNARAVGQHAAQRLKTFEGEWFLDKDAGVSWLSDVLGEKYDPVIAETLIKTEVLETDGVVDIESFSVRFDRQSRGLKSYDISVKTDYDERVDV